MRDRPAVTRVALLAISVALVTACSGDDEPLTAPPSASPPEVSPPPAPSPSPTPSASPSPSPEPLSAFEDDPAVQAMRDFYVAAARAVNADDFMLPELVARSTARRIEINRSTFAEDLGAFVPGPTPFTPVAVQELAPDRRTVLACSVEGGWVLDRPGGTPTEPDEVLGGAWEMRLENGTWKVHRIGDAPDVSCDGVPMPRRPFT